MQLYTRFNLFDGWLALPLVRVDFESLLHRTCLHPTPFQDSLSTSFQLAIISGLFNATSHHFHVNSHIVFKNLIPLLELRPSFHVALHSIHCLHAVAPTPTLALRYRRSSHSSKLIPRVRLAIFFFFFFTTLSANQLALDKMTPFSAALLRQRLDAVIHSIQSLRRLALPLVRVDFESLLHRTCLHPTPFQDSLSTSFQLAIISGLFNATSHHFHVNSHIVFKNLIPLSNFAQVSTLHCTASTVCMRLLRHRLSHCATDVHHTLPS
jgi:hypothetical protein